MDEVIEVEDRFYILAESALQDERTIVLKHGETFGIFNAMGDVECAAHPSHGLFTEGMRYLSRWQTRIDGMRPLLLSSRVTDDNSRAIIDMTNPDMSENGTIVLPRGTLHLMRTLFIFNDACFEKLTLASYSLEPVDVTLSIAFDSDFADIFEVRGTPRQWRGQRLEPEPSERGVALAYRGLDDVLRVARLECDQTPLKLTGSELEFQATIQPRSRTVFCIAVRCEPTSRAASPSFAWNMAQMCDADTFVRNDFCTIESSNDRLNQWFHRSAADIRMLSSAVGGLPYPYAGVPWFSAPFGRDGIITALELLWVNPSIGRGVLAYLAKLQATEADPARDAEPGKILHERRTDEMANLREVPFGQYYGSVDSTPLFVMLAGAYFAATNDRPFIEFLWPNIERALEWIDRYGDFDGDGFVEYQAKTERGLANQGWKDSFDSIFHLDGALAQPPIALCEVQGYVFAAQKAAAHIARALGAEDRAQALLEQADRLQRRFQEAFWLDDLGMYAIALDGEKRPCMIRSSNPGHCLFTGIAHPQHAARLRDEMLGEGMFSGWGIRTLASSEARYNPMSYHNGSIWPHDNALIAAGFARYGFRSAALRIFRAMFDASIFLELHRLPELFCGFRRRQGKGPTLYPVACSPQAWAAGAAFLLLQSCLGLSIDGLHKRIHIAQPRLPRSVQELHIKRLRLGNASLDLLFHREKRDVGVLVTRKDGEIDVLVSK